MDHQFKIKYCDLCKTIYVECPKCGNNCCNAGSGEVNGEPCDFCKWAYEYQDAIWTLEWAMEYLPHKNPEDWPNEDGGYNYHKELHQKALKLLKVCDEPEVLDPKEQELLKKIFGEGKSQDE